MNKADKKEQQKKNDEFNRVSDDDKMKAAGEILGADLVQLSSRMGIKHNLMKNIRTVNLAQLSDDNVFGGSDQPAKEGEQSIADLTSNAKEELKSSIKNSESKEEQKKEPEQSSSTDEGEKKEKTEDAKQDKPEDDSSKENNQNLAEKEKEPTKI